VKIVMQINLSYYFYLAMSNIMNSYINEENKLYGLNYINLKFNMKTLLEGYNAWEIVSGIGAKLPTIAFNSRFYEKRN
jgi:hypothetical protein